MSRNIQLFPVSIGDEIRLGRISVTVTGLVAVGKEIIRLWVQTPRYEERVLHGRELESILHRLRKDIS